MKKIYKIFNLHSNDEKNVKDLKAVIHKEYNKNGKMQKNKYVEFTVIGNNSEWRNFMPFKDFKKLNPDVKIKLPW